jgi:hypothetical protein
MIKSVWACLISLFLAVASLMAQKNVVLPEPNNIEWTSQSKNSSESMPCGGGSIGLNVWVENDDLLFYISKSDAFEENNGLYKLGRVRIRLAPNPFTGAHFNQKLILHDGCISITANKAGDTSEIAIWVDVFRPVIHIELKSSIERTVSATYESWRTETFKERPDENFQNSLKWAPFDTIYTYKDDISFQDNHVLFFHRNRDYTVFDMNVTLQGLDSIRDQLYNPLKNNTYGGLLIGQNMVPSGQTTGRYVETEFKGYVSWKQDNIWAARLGLIDDAAELCIKKLQDGIFRFPAFYGQAYDWTPDHNWGGSGMIGLQEMLLQTTEDKIYLLPAWPKAWDVDFKLCAPYNTIVECVYKNGKIEKLNITPEKRKNDVVLGSNLTK